MGLGYNTHGVAHHTTQDAATILCEIGYASVALTLERSHLDPPDRSAVKQCIEHFEPIIRDAGLCVTIETGSRFILDARRKHQPTLLSASAGDRERRVAFILAAVEVAAAMEADSVSLWSGAAEDKAEEAALFDRLVTGLRKILAHAESHNVRLSFEPEPGMFVETMAQFERLIDAVDHPLLGLTLDVGHVHCLGDGDVADHVRRWKNKLWNLHIEDMRRGEHNHLMFGEGDMDFPAVFDALGEIGYAGPVHVELSRHSHCAVEAAEKSFAFLRGFLPQPGP
ncbi:MAG: sugar phosphate isomerase/epimerase [Planctomycetes bacterium]|nr:sugar phosphate isomerase/epimerase [Planctomycetota bacterium]